MTFRTEELRVKIKSLAAEARIIRIAEKRTFGDIRTSLYVHRVRNVRMEARAALLAFGYLRGTAYQRIEAVSKSEPNWSRVVDIAKRFGGDVWDEKTFNNWRSESVLTKAA